MTILKELLVSFQSLSPSDWLVVFSMSVLVGGIVQVVLMLTSRDYRNRWGI